MNAREAAELAARTSYGRLVAYLAKRTRDLTAAEDALADAFAAALEAWARDGVPLRPEAWLLTAARRRLVDRARHARVRGEAASTLVQIAEAAAARAATTAAFPDERLSLMFVCAHPALDPAARTALMLQTVLGLDAARIASAFLVSPATMSQRLVRAKAKLRELNVRFEVPAVPEWGQRTEAVLAAIYAAYDRGAAEAPGADPRGAGLAPEALWLARVMASLMPDHAEAQGLLALLLHCEARRAARRDADGAYVPLAEQDPAQWSGMLIDEAERVLHTASTRLTLGRYQLEAAIQSAHAARGRTGRTDWEAVALLYEGLVAIAPAIGAQVGRAAALSEARGPEVGLAALDAIEGKAAVAAYQPYWAVRAEVLRRLRRHDAAGEAYGRAIGLAEDPAVRAYLQSRMRPLQPTPQDRQAATASTTVGPSPSRARISTWPSGRRT